ncbi:MAG: hypothetical protein AB8G15_17460 [Saprospiraceae bacterium]
MFRQIIFLFFLSVSIVACTENKHAPAEDLSASNPEAIVSENGIYLAHSLEDLKALIRPATGSLFSRDLEFKITNFDFLETNTTTAIMIDLQTTDQKQYRMLYARELDTERNIEKCYTITCDSDCLCQPNGTVVGSGVNFTCNGDCSCAMTIREHDCRSKN